MNRSASQIGPRLKIARTMLGMDEAALAAALDVTKEQIVAFETGRGKLSMDINARIIVGVMVKLPQINIDWLGAGRGLMLQVEEGTESPSNGRHVIELEPAAPLPPTTAVGLAPRSPPEKDGTAASAMHRAGLLLKGLNIIIAANQGGAVAGEVAEVIGEIVNVTRSIVAEAENAAAEI